MNIIRNMLEEIDIVVVAKKIVKIIKFCIIDNFDNCIENFETKIILVICTQNNTRPDKHIMEQYWGQICLSIFIVSLG